MHRVFKLDHPPAGLLCLLVSLLAPSVAVAEEPVQVFLLAGQSNMAGRARTSKLPQSLQQPQADVVFHYGDENSQTTTTLRPGSGRDFGPEITFGRTLANSQPSEPLALIKHADGGTSLSFPRTC
jgi:hypothetical protein